MAKVGFCAIAGSGMSALAQILKFKGYDVYGSDRSFDQKQNLCGKKALESLGIKIFPQDGSMIEEDFEALYVSSAVEDTVSDVKKAKEFGITIKKRSDLLAEIFSNYKYRVAVGGTSGKSTVTAMIGYILDKVGYMPTTINGALLKNYEKNDGIANVILNNGDYVVIEADESDGSIEKYVPTISVVNNVSLDHKSLKELQELFFNFAKRATKSAVVNLDCKNSRCLFEANPNVISFGIENSKADFFANNVRAVANGTVYCFRGKEYKLKLIGAFNVLNAMSAVATCFLLGVDPHKACEVLENFEGTKRRLEVLGQKNDITIIDDFAHNPDKVKGSMSALKSYEGRLIVMFQPHGFSPMRLMGKEIIKEFSNFMDKEDVLLIPEIFFAGGTVSRDISSKDIVNFAQEKGVNALFFENREGVKQYILQNAKPKDRIVLMGARDNSITDLGFEILERL